jgi:polyphosphate kinase 2 (PPK2 family)
MRLENPKPRTQNPELKTIMIQLKDYSSDAPPNVDKDEIKDLTDDMIDRLGKLQEILYAQKKYSLLIVYQGMDASGKDGATEKVFKDCHPAGLHVISFKKTDRRRIRT